MSKKKLKSFRIQTTFSGGRESEMKWASLTDIDHFCVVYFTDTDRLDLIANMGGERRVLATVNHKLDAGSLLGISMEGSVLQVLVDGEPVITHQIQCAVAPPEDKRRLEWLLTYGRRVRDAWLVLIGRRWIDGDDY